MQWYFTFENFILVYEQKECYIGMLGLITRIVVYQVSLWILCIHNGGNTLHFLWIKKKKPEWNWKKQKKSCEEWVDDRERERKREGGREKEKGFLLSSIITLREVPWDLNQPKTPLSYESPCLHVLNWVWGKKSLSFYSLKNVQQFHSWIYVSPHFE